MNSRATFVRPSDEEPPRPDEPSHEGQLDAFPRLFDRRHDRREYRNLAPERSTLAKFLAASLRAD
jgi:hypothetical protein